MTLKFNWISKSCLIIWKIKLKLVCFSNFCDVLCLTANCNIIIGLVVILFGFYSCNCKSSTKIFQPWSVTVWRWLPTWIQFEAYFFFFSYKKSILLLWHKVYFDHVSFTLSMKTCVANQSVIPRSRTEFGRIYFNRSPVIWHFLNRITDVPDS